MKRIKRVVKKKKEETVLIRNECIRIVESRRCVLNKPHVGTIYNALKKFTNCMTDTENTALNHAIYELCTDESLLELLRILSQ